MLGLGEPLPDWFNDGKCRHIGLHLAVVFLYPKMGRGTDHSSQKIAKEICEGCPILIDCRTYGKKQPGIWGGMTVGERQQWFAEQNKGKNLRAQFYGKKGEEVA